ncbi:MAG: methyltransferase, CheR-type [Conexibacter sp.]|nr:methyltransferase, CheR-type [Conexibacter sp.]
MQSEAPGRAVATSVSPSRLDPMQAHPATSRPADTGRAALSRVSALPLDSFRVEHLDMQVRRALSAEGVADELALADRLAGDPRARTRFRRSIAVSVTGPFRDPQQFALLAERLLPPLIAQGGRLRVWSAGCADGSELVSVGTVLDRLGGLDRAYLLGSDLLAENIARATRDEADLPPALRARLRWEHRDVVATPPPSGRWQLVLCRNVAIYLTRAAQEQLHRRLAAALAPGGVLLLGRAERIAEPAAAGLVPAGPHAYHRAA